jgi:signal transduction histidine kinase
MGKELLGGEEINPCRLIEFEVIKRDMSRAFLEVSLLKLFKDQVLTGFQVSARDIMEQRNLREMIVKAERLGDIGQMGIAVRHEINNPLTTVIGNVELLIERYEHKDKDLTARLEVVLNNALRIAEITKRLQEIKKENIVDYRTGVNVTDLTRKNRRL